MGIIQSHQHMSPEQKLIDAIINFPLRGGAVPPFSKQEIDMLLAPIKNDYSTIRVTSKLCNILKENHGIEATSISKFDVVKNFKNVENHVHYGIHGLHSLVKEVHLFIEHNGGYLVTIREDIDEIIIESVIPKS
jgi:hypothetical protein